MRLKERQGKLVIEGKYGESTIHLVHCNETLLEISEDVAKPYLVAEEAGNSARLHLVTDFSEDEALQQVAEYLTEQENEEFAHIIAVQELEVTI